MDLIIAIRARHTHSSEVDTLSCLVESPRLLSCARPFGTANCYPLSVSSFRYLLRGSLRAPSPPLHEHRIAAALRVFFIPVRMHAHDAIICLVCHSRPNDAFCVIFLLLQQTLRTLASALESLSDVAPLSRVLDVDEGVGGVLGANAVSRAT